MSAVLPPEGDEALMPLHNSSQDELSDVDIDGDGSSSLSEIEDKDAEQDEEEELSNDSEENDSEAETERLEATPQKPRRHQDVVVSAGGTSLSYEQSPSKLRHGTTYGDDEDEDDDQLSDIEDDENNNSATNSGDSAEHDEREPEETATAATTLEDSSSEGKKSLSVTDLDSKKRKRSIMAGSGLDLEEPLRKRTGSVITPGNDYAIEDGEIADEEGDLSNPISANGSVDGGADAQDEAEEAVAEEEAEAPVEIIPSPKSPKKRGRKKKKVTENGTQHHDDRETAADGEVIANGEEETKNGDDDNADQDLDEAEAALKNEEELEKKRIALDQLGAIEKQFAVFRDRLYEERLEQLNREEAMLKQDNPTHPEYLAMLQCIDARRDERLRIGENLRKFELQTLKNCAVARRAQILTQYQQDVRDIREKKLEQIGRQWYEIQHDRRMYAGNVPDYAIKFPRTRNQQLMNQIAYNNEVSILSGIAKYVGFPAAPPMAATTDAEMAEDLEKMGRSRHPIQSIQRQAFPLQDLPGLRAAGSSSALKPAEEQFIEQTPWANPQHPSHAHLLQRQTSAQQIPRTSSPFSHSQIQPRRNSHQQGTGVPISGTFSSNSGVHHTNGSSVSGGRISPHNPFTNSHTHTVAPSPLGSRQPSLSPQQSGRPPPEQHQRQQASLMEVATASSAGVRIPRAGDLGEPTREFPREGLKREQQMSAMVRY